MAISHKSNAGLKVKELLSGINKRLSKNSVVLRMSVGQYSINDKMWVNVNKWTYGKLVVTKSKKKKGAKGRTNGAKTKKAVKPAVTSVVQGDLDADLKKFLQNENPDNVNFKQIEADLKKIPTQDGNIFEETESAYNDRVNESLENLDGYSEFNRNSDMYSEPNDWD